MYERGYIWLQYRDRSNNARQRKLGEVLVDQSDARFFVFANYSRKNVKFRFGVETDFNVQPHLPGSSVIAPSTIIVGITSWADQENYIVPGGHIFPKVLKQGKLRIYRYNHPVQAVTRNHQA